MSKEKISELHNLMKEAKMYSLPTSCKCGYVAKKNWIEMENHYCICSQYRNAIKIRVKTMKQKHIDVKSIGIDTIEKVEKVAIELRRIEKEKKGAGYEQLEFIKKDIPESLYGGLKTCLDNPEAEIKCHLHYKTNDNGNK